MTYIGSSSLLKTLWEEPESKSVRQAIAKLASFRSLVPFEFRDLSGSVFRRAIDQHVSAGELHCRSLDRLHLAAMQELGAKRLLTNDNKQAATARALGYDVVSPGASKIK